VTFFIIYALAACTISVASVVSGLIVPAITMGAAAGRFLGLALALIFNHGENTPFNPGAYAAVGASAFLVGSTGNAFSSCVLVIEVMADFSFFIPVVIGTIVAYILSGYISDPIFTLIILARRLPVLAVDPPRYADRKLFHIYFLNDRYLKCQACFHFI